MPRSLDLFGSQAFGNLSSGLIGGYTDLAMTFSTPQQAVGAYAGKIDSSGPFSLTVKVFDSSNDLLESTSLTLNSSPGGLPHSFVGFSEPGGISSIEWIGGNSGFFGVDNVTYGVVPEPSCVALGALVAPLLLARRRRRAASN